MRSKSYCQWLEFLGLVLLFAVAVIEVRSIQNVDYKRAQYEQSIEFQILIDQINFQSDLQQINSYMLQQSGTVVLSDYTEQNVSDYDKFVKALYWHLDIYDRVFDRLIELSDTIFLYREDMSLSQSEKLTHVKSSLESLKQALNDLKEESNLDDDGFKYPITHLKELEALVIFYNKDINELAKETAQELESERNCDATFHLVLMVIGSILTLLGKFLEIRKKPVHSELQ
ncbi:hypothetical protein P3652_23065 [Vibrio parahaemolyticus]|nr:hypothetical protein [Vibrio parahaemolyticus]